MKTLAAVVLVVALVAAPLTAAVAQDNTMVDKNIVETAQAAGNFKTLLAAAKAAGLADTLATTKNITVFAPTDAAFAALPAGTVQTLLKPENHAKLVAILEYHVVPKEVPSADVPMKPTEVPTLDHGKMLTVENTGSSVKVDNATVVTPDVMASNGVIHAIDKVLIPAM